MKRGVDGVLLAYVTRKATEIPEDAPDYGEPTFDDEMILRAPHTGNTYQQDNRLVWTMLQSVFHGGPGWNWVSSFARSANGHAAYVAVNQHYLGEAFQSRIRAAADKTLTEHSLMERPGHLCLRDIASNSTMSLPALNN
jgi:hypothetical protein